MGFVLDLALAGVAALFAWRLSRKARFNGHLCVWLWAAAFAAMGGGVLLGVFHNMLAIVLQGGSGDMLLRLSLALRLLTHALLLSGALLAYTSGRTCWGGLAAVALKLAAFLVYIGNQASLDAVIFDGVLTSLLLLALCTYGAWTWKYPHGQWIVAGAIVWLFAAVLHQGKVGAGTSLPPAQIFSAALIVVLSLMVRGGWHLRDQPDTHARLAQIKRMRWRAPPARLPEP